MSDFTRVHKPRNLLVNESIDMSTIKTIDDMNQISWEFRTSKMYYDVFRNDYENFKSIPLEFITQQMCIEYVAYCINFSVFLNFTIIPKIFLTQQMCIEIVKYYLSFPNIYDLSISLTKMISFIPEKMVCDEICHRIINYCIDNIHKNNNYFDYAYILFSPKSPILIALTKHEKTEICVKIFNSYIDEKYSHYKTDDGKLISHMFECLEVCDYMFDELFFKHKKSICFFPQNKRTKQMCDEIFDCLQNNKTDDIDYQILHYVPEKYFTQQICDELFKQNILTFSIIPNQFKTQKMCDNAFEHWKNNNILYNNENCSTELFLYKIPHCYRTKKMHMETMNLGYSYHFEPLNFDAKEFYDELFSLNIFNIKVINKQYITKEMYDIVYDFVGNLADEIDECVKSDSDMLSKYKKQIEWTKGFFSYLPTNFVTRENCEKVFSKAKLTFFSIPNKFKTKKMCGEFIEYIGANKFFCDELFDESLILRIFPRSEIKEHLYETLAEYGLLNNSILFDTNSCDYITQKICNLMFDYDQSSYFVMNHEFRTVDMWNKLDKSQIDIDGKDVLLVPSCLMTLEMCEKAVEYDFNYYDFVPGKFITKKMSYEYFKQTSLINSISDEKFITVEMYYKTCKSETTDFLYMPLKIIPIVICCFLTKDDYICKLTILKKHMNSDILLTVVEHYMNINDNYIIEECIENVLILLKQNFSKSTTLEYIKELWQNIIEQVTDELNNKYPMVFK